MSQEGISDRNKKHDFTFVGEFEKWTMFTPFLRLIVMESLGVTGVKERPRQMPSFTDHIHTQKFLPCTICSCINTHAQLVFWCRHRHQQTLEYIYIHKCTRGTHINSTFTGMLMPVDTNICAAKPFLAETLQFLENILLCLIYDLLQVLLIKTHIPSLYMPAHLTLSISVSYLTLISGSLNPFISVKSHLIECLQFLDFIHEGLAFYCVNLNMISYLEQMCELAWSFLDVRF